MDKVVTKAGMMHKHCLSCNECKTNLDVSSFYNGFDGEVYCKYCYAVKFGHRQKSNYKGWMDVKAIMGEKGERSACPRCYGKVHLQFTYLLTIFFSRNQSLIFFNKLLPIYFISKASQMYSHIRNM